MVRTGRLLVVTPLGILTLPLLDLYGRVGVSRWEVDCDLRFNTDDALTTTRSPLDGTDPTWLDLGSRAGVSAQSH